MPNRTNVYIGLCAVLALSLPSCDERQKGSEGSQRDQGIQTTGAKPNATPTKGSGAGSGSADTISDGTSATGPLDTSQNSADGCKGIDFLVVVDNSRSMAGEQSNLIASFPGFLDTIEASVKASQSTFHVLVTDTDSDGCEHICRVYPDSRCRELGNIRCRDYDKSAPRSCDHTLGAGRVVNGAKISCGLKKGRFITSADDNRQAAFRCLGLMGIGGDGGERTMQATTAAVSPELVGPGGCNEGFLRKDAILVVLFVTDEEDGQPGDRFGQSPGDPQAWHDALVAAKGGDKSAVVAVGLVGDVGQPSALCKELMSKSGEGAEHSPRLIEFVNKFGDHGRWGSVCAPDYNPFLQDVVKLVTESCDDFEPPPE